MKNKPLKPFSKERRAYTRKFYNLKLWKRKRAFQLRKIPLCEICLSIKKVTAATVVDHIVPWENQTDFLKNDLQSLCHSCHNMKTHVFDVQDLLKKRKTKIEYF